jgi:hypothetical protein
MDKCNQSHIPFEWDGISYKVVKEWKGNSIRVVLCKLALGAAVYYLWKMRNDIKCGTQLISEDRMLRQICWEVRS